MATAHSSESHSPRVFFFFFFFLLLGFFYHSFNKDCSKAVLLLRFIFICYDIYNVCLLHDFVATLRLSALPSALYFVLSKVAL